MSRVYMLRLGASLLAVLTITVLVVTGCPVNQAVAVAETAPSDVAQLAEHLATELVRGLEVPEARVIAVEGNDVYLNVGSEAGVRPAMRFEVFRKGREVIDPVTGESLGPLLFPVASLEVYHVQERFAVARIIEKSAEVEVGMVARTGRAPPRVAVLEVEASDSARELGALLPDLLLTSLARTKRVVLLERAQIEAAVKELGFGQSGLARPDAVKKLGQFLGADYLVIGSVRSLEGSPVVTLRALTVADGTVQTVVTARLGEQPKFTVTGLPPGLTLASLRVWAEDICWDWFGGRLGYGVPVTGEFRNDTSVHYRDLKFKVSVYDEAHRFIAEDAVVIPEARPNSVTLFKIYVFLGKELLGKPAFVEMEYVP